jgi:hypothetical protein
MSLNWAICILSGWGVRNFSPTRSVFVIIAKFGQNRCFDCGFRNTECRPIEFGIRNVECGKKIERFRNSGI